MALDALLAGWRSYMLKVCVLIFTQRFCAIKFRKVFRQNRREAKIQVSVKNFDKLILKSSIFYDSKMRWQLTVCV
jgi:hypothetical protein